MAWASDPPFMECYLSENQLKVMPVQLRYGGRGVN